jgi:hypothetical protein
MPASTALTTRATAYGARAVSVDTVRGLPLTEVATEPQPDGPGPPAALPLNRQTAADRLSLAHWPWGHQIVVCSLAGGVGRTSFSGLLATVLAELPFAHIWPPIAVCESTPRVRSSTSHRWGVTEAPEPGGVGSTRSGAWAFLDGARPARRQDFSALVIDAPAGIPSDHDPVQTDPDCSVLLLVRPDRASLAEAAEVLVWLNDDQLLPRRRVVIVVNEGAGSADRGSKAAATALWTRCSAVHRLPFSTALGPGRVLPSGHDLLAPLRRVLTHTALDLWSVATHHPPPTAELTDLKEHHEPPPNSPPHVAHVGDPGRSVGRGRVG